MAVGGEEEEEEVPVAAAAVVVTRPAAAAGTVVEGTVVEGTAPPRRPKNNREWEGEERETIVPAGRDSLSSFDGKTNPP